MADVLCSVVIGRHEELRALAAALGDAESGRGGAVILTGEAGIGKSRLTREVMERAEKHGVLVAVGRAVPAGDSTPYRPLTEAMLQILRDRSLPDDDALTPWLPALTAIVPVPDAESHGEASPAARGEAVIQLLRSVGSDDGVVVVLEDLHWADPDTLAVVEYLAGNVSHERVLCVITARSEAASAGLELIRRLRGRPGIVHLPLTRLDHEQVALMVHACDPAAGEQLLARVQQRAEGIPLLVEELLASPGVPRSFADTVATRLADLSPDELLVLEAAALLGRRFDWHLLPAATGLGPDLVAGSLERAVERLLIIIDGDGFRFRHALTRDAVLEATLPPRRARLAAQVLAVIESADPDLGEGRRELAADLAAQSGDRERAGTLLAASGRESMERGALETAIETLRRATEMSAGSPELLTDTERLLVGALSLAGRVDEAISVGNHLIKRLQAGGAAAEAAEIHLQLAHAAVSATRWRIARLHLEAAKELLATESRSELDARAAVVEAEIALASDDVERARQLAMTALQAAGAGADVRCNALEILGRSERLDDLTAARQTFERALALAEDNGLAIWRLRALHELGTIEMFESGGTHRLDEARLSAARLGALSNVAVLDLQLAVTRDASFSLDAGAVHARESVQLAERLGLDQVRAKALYFLAENSAYRRERDEMERYLALALAASTGDAAGEGFAWGARGCLAFLEDDWAGAVEALERAVAVFSELPHAEPANFRCLWPLLLAATADQRAEAALTQARAARIDRAFTNAGMLAYAEAILVGHRDPTRATELAVAAEGHLTFPGPWPNFARLCAAEPALTDRWGDPERWLDAALDCFVSLGLDRLSEHCRRLLDPPVMDGWMQLGITARESDVLTLVAEGRSNKDIAACLRLSPRTVEKHLESLLRKTGARSRTALAMITAPRAGSRSSRTSR